jgi:hypothetical protein
MTVVNSGNNNVTIVGDVVGRTVKGTAAAVRTADRGGSAAVVNTGSGTVTVAGRKSGKGSK